MLKSLEFFFKSQNIWTYLGCSRLQYQNLENVLDICTVPCWKNLGLCCLASFLHTFAQQPSIKDYSNTWMPDSWWSTSRLWIYYVIGEGEKKTNKLLFVSFWENWVFLSGRGQNNDFIDTKIILKKVLKWLFHMA